jgi:hypothetical protein
LRKKDSFPIYKIFGSKNKSQEDELEIDEEASLIDSFQELSSDGGGGGNKEAAALNDDEDFDAENDHELEANEDDNDSGGEDGGGAGDKSGSLNKTAGNEFKPNKK